MNNVTLSGAVMRVRVCMCDVRQRRTVEAARQAPLLPLPPPAALSPGAVLLLVLGRKVGGRHTLSFTVIQSHHHLHHHSGLVGDVAIPER